MRSKENIYIASPARSLLLIIAIAGLLLPIFTTALAGPPPGWVKVYNPRGTRRGHNIYEVKTTMGGEELSVKNVRCGDLAGDPVIPDGSYYVTFWVEDPTTKKEVEHKEKLDFTSGNAGSITLTVAGKITSAGVTYPS